MGKHCLICYAVNQGLSLSEIQKIIDKEKSENEEMTSKFNSKLQQLGVSIKSQTTEFILLLFLKIRFTCIVRQMYRRTQLCIHGKYIERL